MGAPGSKFSQPLGMGVIWELFEMNDKYSEWKHEERMQHPRGEFFVQIFVDYGAQWDKSFLNLYFD